MDYCDEVLEVLARNGLRDPASAEAFASKHYAGNSATWRMEPVWLCHHTWRSPHGVVGAGIGTNREQAMLAAVADVLSASGK